MELQKKLSETNTKKISFQIDTPYTTVPYNIIIKVLRFLDSAKSMFYRVFGTHIFRKTFYLFGKLGGGKYEDLKYCARHLSEESANKVRSVYFTIYLMAYFKSISSSL
jgi:hypothetical protein